MEHLRWAVVCKHLLVKHDGKLRSAVAQSRFAIVCLGVTYIVASLRRSNLKGGFESLGYGNSGDPGRFPTVLREPVTLRDAWWTNVCFPIRCTATRPHACSLTDIP